MRLTGAVTHAAGFALLTSSRCGSVSGPAEARVCLTLVWWRWYLWPRQQGDKQLTYLFFDVLHVGGRGAKEAFAKAGVKFCQVCDTECLC